MFAAESGRSNVRTQILSSRISRVIVGPEESFDFGASMTLVPIFSPPLPFPFSPLCPFAVWPFESDSSKGNWPRSVRGSVVLGLLFLGRSEVGGWMFTSVPFQPKRAALSAADTQCDQRALFVASLQFLQT